MGRRTTKKEKKYRLQAWALVEGLLKSYTQYINNIKTTYWPHLRKNNREIRTDRWQKLMEQRRSKTLNTYTCKTIQFTVVGNGSSHCAVRINIKKQLNNKMFKLLPDFWCFPTNSLLVIRNKYRFPFLYTSQLENFSKISGSVQVNEQDGRSVWQLHFHAF